LDGIFSTATVVNENESILNREKRLNMRETTIHGGIKWPRYRPNAGAARVQRIHPCLTEPAQMRYINYTV
jgi:hypothetical protein